MAVLLFVTKIGKAEIRQWHDSKLYHVEYTNTEGRTVNLGDFNSLIQARNAAYRFRTGMDTQNSDKDWKG